MPFEPNYNLRRNVEAHHATLFGTSIGRNDDEKMFLILGITDLDEVEINVCFSMKDAIQIRDFVDKAVAQYPEILNDC